MNKIEAKNLVKSTFESNFDEYTYKNFINNLFQNINFKETNLIVKNQYEDYISDALKIGKCELTGNTIELLIIKTKKVKSLYNAKTMQRNFIANYVNQTSSYGAIVAFVSPNNESWRFSFVKVNYKYDSVENKLKKEISSAKRWSFLAGNKEKSNTLQNNIVPLLEKQNFSITEFENAFSIEPVTKEFYKEIQSLFIELKNDIKYPDVTNEEGKKEFIVRLIGRLLFVWFLKKKIDIKNLNSEKIDRYQNYYHDYLEKLFFEVLNKPKKTHPDFAKGKITPPFFSQSEKEGILIKENKDDSPVGADLHIRPNDFANDFDSIPFLNGGLFEANYYDFYEFDNFHNQSKFYHSLVIKNDWLKKIINLFEQYNFTIDESSSNDIEISIDPEMLGRIFENLLAEINPETGESARRANGSYYTPREIVDYMVTESLKEYLKEKTGKGENLINGIFQFDEETEIDKETVKEIIKALNEVKILDPACGSGAFPMGILQKILLILKKIDKNNEMWLDVKFGDLDSNLKNLFLEKTKGESIDYQMKLSIIQNSIFGVDILPIAVEIARLRFFLSLLVEQETNENISEIKPLPNLDFKFVCANSLIGLTKKEDNKKAIKSIFGEPPQIKRLKELRSKFFTSYGKDKLKIEEDFIKVQNELADFHIKEGKDYESSDIMKYISEWQPFSNKTSPFFDPEWMFGIKEGFDIVIGNPPYIKERGNKHIFELVNNNYLGKKYHQGKMDYWYYFLHLAINLIEKNGIIALITPRYWINSSGSSKLIERIKNELNFIIVIDIGKLTVFDTVTGHHMISIYSKKNRSEMIYKKLLNNLSGIDKLENDENIIFRKINNHKIFTTNNEIVFDTYDITFKNCVKLSEILDVSQGVVEATDKVNKKNIGNSNFEIGKGVFVISKNELNDLKLSSIEEKYIKKYISPKDVGKYYINYNNEYLIYSDKIGKNLIANNKEFIRLKEHLDNMKDFITSSNKPYGIHRPRSLEYFINPKIVFKGMFSFNEFTYDENEYFFGMSFLSIINKSNFKVNLKFILALLNSKLALFWFFNNGKHRGGGVDIGVGKINEFPIKITEENKTLPFISLVDYVLFLNTFDFAHNTDLNFARERLMISYFEQIIDAMVYELYFEEELHKHDKYFISVLQKEEMPKITNNSETDLKNIKTFFEKIFHKDHTIRKNVFFLDTLEIIKIIEGK